MKIVLALGGNALQSDPKDKSCESQLKTCKETAKSIVDLIEEGHTISVVHGNGPQVGQIVAAVEAAQKFDKVNVLFPFDVCGAFSQGYIGYHLQNAIGEELRNRNIDKTVVTIVTQVVVDKDDEGFKNPTKPIGSFYLKEEAEKLEKEHGYIMKEDSGRGYRRVVASPKPIDVIERDIIKQLVNTGNLVISCGGGGIPVIREGTMVKGVSAVIDKDFAAEILAEILDADVLLILTGVDRVCVNFNKQNQKELVQITIDEANKYIDEGQFAPGSMLPKIEACKKFIINNKDKTAIIVSLSKVREALMGTSGTKIVY
ncbi:carbamate kinase [Clostridium algoriphilum]|uniref:carbamate kinase n=1 Tax=Clostridium algoriphilum TaxID=198347 RepID=UPI001CF22F75|nr:carbamate kinase [Clostridium algoriphilum]MCB2293082.1 carbamate kinase [Clostridium algoriphilum]